MTSNGVSSPFQWSQEHQRYWIWKRDQRGAWIKEWAPVGAGTSQSAETTQLALEYEAADSHSSINTENPVSIAYGYWCCDSYCTRAWVDIVTYLI
jgi:hypothetical protein